MLDLQTISAMYAMDHDSCQAMKFVCLRTTCSVAIQNMGLKLELKLLKQLVFILLCLFLICAEYEFETFGSTSDQIRLMAFYLHTDVIDVGLETIHSISIKTCIITKDLWLTCTDN